MGTIFSEDREHIADTMRVILLMIPLLLLTSACGTERSNTDAAGEPDETIPFTPEGQLTFFRGADSLVTITIEVADTDSARARGLMQRTSLPERSGMFFYMDREEIQSFWMANTPLALDIIFVDADSQIVDVDKYTRPLSSERVVSDRPALYVIEVPAGFADTYGLTETDHVRWHRTAR